LKASHLWTATFVFLLLTLVTGGVALYWRYPRTPSLEIIIPSPTPLPSPTLEGTSPTPQRVDINRAEPWLLEALPGIGPSLADAIISYRQENGPFHSPEEITRVPGIGVGVYDKIKNLITVGEITVGE
jgi:competence ComEA-like helix-hairpin-helix protein